MNEWRAYSPAEVKAMSPLRYLHVWNHLMAECARFGINTSRTEVDWDESDDRCFDDIQQAVAVARANENVDESTKRFIDSSLAAT